MNNKCKCKKLSYHYEMVQCNNCGLEIDNSISKRVLSRLKQLGFRLTENNNAYIFELTYKGVYQFFKVKIIEILSSIDLSFYLVTDEDNNPIEKEGDAYFLSMNKFEVKTISELREKLKMFDVPKESINWNPNELELC